MIYYTLIAFIISLPLSLNTGDSKKNIKKKIKVQKDKGSKVPDTLLTYLDTLLTSLDTLLTSLV